MGKIRENRADKGIAIYIEMMVLMAVFTAVTVILVKGFLTAGRLANEATELSKAVHLAQNAAEIASSSTGADMLFILLNENGNTYSMGETDDVAHGALYRAKYDEDMMPAADGIFWVDVSWVPDGRGMARSIINVCKDGGVNSIYALEFETYIGK